MFILQNLTNFILLAIFGYAGYTYLRGREQRLKQRVKEQQVQGRIQNDTAMKVRAIGHLTNGIDAFLLHIASDEKITNETGILAAANRGVDSLYFSWLNEYGYHFYLPMSRVKITGVHGRIALYELPEPLCAFLEKHVK